MPTLRTTILCLLSLHSNWVLASPTPSSPNPVIIEDFTLNDSLGAKHSFGAWKEKRAIVVVFLGTECPLAKLYGKRLAKMNREYAKQGVQFVGINSNRQDTLQELAVYGKKHKIEFPLLKDPGGKVAQQFCATRTPEAFLLDGDGKIHYQGRIDDQYGVGTARNEPRVAELQEALDAMLAGEPIKKPHTQAVGCLISMPLDVEPTGEVTYSKQISRILQKHCVSCHRQGQIAPFALENYDDASAWAETMLEVIDNRRMPPWHANPKHGDFLNDARMPDEEKELFRSWVTNGLPEGDAGDLPEPPKFAEGWQIPEPDVVYQMPEPFMVPATGVVDYQHFYFDPKFKEDKWISGAEARPGNPEVVHHIILFYVPPDQKRHRPEDALFNLIAGFAPGMPAVKGRPGHAMRIPAGSKLVFQVHYTPNGTRQSDISEAGLLFAEPSDVKKEIFVKAGLNFRFLIPPGDPDYVVKANYKLPEEMLLYTLAPHMHYRGKSFRFTASYPDGKQEVLLDVPNYDFNWQNVYMLKEAKQLPAGTSIDMVAHFDNSAENPLNPDPSARVHWGDQTWQEMMLGSLGMSLADENLQAAGPQTEKLPSGNYLVTFTYLPSKSVETVHLGGDFNGWKPEDIAMQGPDEEGRFAIQQELPAGTHEYKFIENGKAWKSDPGNANQRGYYRNSVLELK
ncbi:redoxin domain-containing protein [Adhaeretor mobilis]|uniref:Thiol-disulfide oxidoreductase n=1 Tax=Adhaeretor mobilis TaxID=1930276 RepID=A0A517MR79_9BACT|nr:redoxin domain-containing protein [Adhaeretor mobilis]QDS97393.1 thiol-disulfide oxidoreductase [Adhaeretor mobilis]